MLMEKFPVRAIAALSGISSLRLLGLFMILPVFSIYAERLTNSTATLIGLALGIYGLTQALFQIPFGFLSDRFGRRLLIIIGLLLFSVGSMISAMSDSITGVIIGRSLQGMGAIGSVIMAMIADLTHPEIRLRAMAFLGITIGISFGLAFILGPILASKWGVSGIFWINALFGIVAIFILQTFVPEPKSMLTLNKQKENFSIKMLFRMRMVHFIAQEFILLNSLSVVYFGVFALHASLTALFLIIPGLLLDLNLPETDAYLFYTPLLIASVFGSVPLFYYLEKSKNYKISFLIAACMMLFSEISFLIISHTLLQLALSLCFFFAALNVLEASFPSFISKKAQVEKKGLMLGFFSSVQFLGLFAGGLIGGWLNSMGGKFAVLSFCVILALIWLVWIFCSVALKEEYLWLED